MIAQEKILQSRRVIRTAKAKGPLLWIISSKALLLAALGASVPGAEGTSWRKSRASDKVETMVII
jgi:hypothetical protein